MVPGVIPVSTDFSDVMSPVLDQLSTCCPRPLAAGALCLTILFGSQTVDAEVRLEITGLTEELEENVRAVVGTLPKDESRSVRRFVRDLEGNTRSALSALGYYAADINIDTDDVISSSGATDANPDGRDVVITINAAPNDPVRVNTVNLTITGPALEDERFMSAIPELPLIEGEVFLSAEYESIKNLILGVAQDLGYFDLRLPLSEVTVSRQNLTADVDIMVASGERYTFGNVLFDGEAFSNEFLSRWLTFEPEEPFEMDKVAESTDNLRNSGYFKSVRVIPQRDARYGKVVPVQVTLEEKDNNLVGVGIGFQTDIGPRVSLSWEKPLINRYGHSAVVDLEVSEPRQSASFNYRIPRKKQPLTNYWGLETGFLNEDFGDDTPSSFRSTLAVERVSRTTHDFQQSLFLRWENEISTFGDVEDRVDLLLPGVSYSRSRSKGDPHTRWGQAESFAIYGGSDDAFSTIDFFKTTFSFRYLREFSEKNYFIGSIGLGWIASNDFERVPASQRFFAGGDRSVRGFRYRDVSPINAAGIPNGGRYLEEFSIEYNRRFRDQFRWAAFVDVGRAFNTYDEAYSAGAGVGVRWDSPVGPFRLDVATPISDNDGGAVRFHISLGPDL